MILTGFADPDTEKFSSQPPPPLSERPPTIVSVPPPAIGSTPDAAPVAPESKR